MSAKNLFTLKNHYIEVILDILIFSLSYFLAFYLRLDGNLSAKTQSVILYTLPLVIIVRTLFFFTYHVYRRHWKYASLPDALSLLKAITLSTLIIAVLIYTYNKYNYFPRTVLIIDWMVVTILVGGVKFSRRLLKALFIDNSRQNQKVLIIGAGRVGKSIINEMKANWELGYNPVALIDDDPALLNQVFYGVKVHGTRMSIPHIVEKMEIDEIIIALPHVNGKNMREIVNLCRLTKKPFKKITVAESHLEQRDLRKRIENIKIEDLLGRKPVKINFKVVNNFIEGKRILVTGAAGSIGSELCRQISEFNPDRLIAFDRHENGLFYLDRELSEKYNDLEYSLALSDITDYNETNRVFEQYKPHLVFHAAAYKHVPMMEMNPHQAIKNNIIGTKNVLDVALNNDVKKFIFISTDKAVNPSNFMGMSKRVAEQYVQAYNEKSNMCCVAVRFGNVMGSSGSVIRLFQEQIERGGPITVTHPDVARFFMTIPEAVQLVLQAATLGKGGEIFILKMGDLVKIYDVAKELILLSGKEPNKDIKINFTGLRPGEKIIEELWEDSENCKEDFNENLYIIRNGAIKNIDLYDKKINKVIESSPVLFNNLDGLKSKLESIVYSEN